MCSSVVERCPDKTEALGPIPSTRTRLLKPFTFMNNDNNNKKPWWREGVLLSAKVSGYIAFPVIITSYIGKYLDKKYNTSPYLFYILIAFGFASTIYLIWKEMKIYQRKIEKENMINDNK